MNGRSCFAALESENHGSTLTLGKQPVDLRLLLFSSSITMKVHIKDHNRAEVSFKAKMAGICIELVRNRGDPVRIQRRGKLRVQSRSDNDFPLVRMDLDKLNSGRRVTRYRGGRGTGSKGESPAFTVAGSW